MLTPKYFSRLVEQGLIASVRVVPVPLSQSWCIDAIVRQPLEAGSSIDTIATASDTQASASEKLRTFDSIDAAAGFLRDSGIKTFTVDIADAVSFAGVDAPSVRIIETTMRLWNDADAQSSKPASASTA